jgi:hypothetical protein
MRLRIMAKRSSRRLCNSHTIQPNILLLRSPPHFWQFRKTNRPVVLAPRCWLTNTKGRQERRRMLAYRDTTVIIRQGPPFLILPSFVQPPPLPPGITVRSTLPPHPIFSLIPSSSQQSDTFVLCCTIYTCRGFNCRTSSDSFLNPLRQSRKLRIGFAYPGRHLAGRITTNIHPSLPLFSLSFNVTTSRLSLIWRITLTSVQSTRALLRTNPTLLLDNQHRSHNADNRRGPSCGSRPVSYLTKLT